MTSDSGSLMVVFLILILIFSLFITFLILNRKKITESYNNYNYKPFGGRPPDASPSCCGNLDWYLGSEKYNQYCAGKEEDYNPEKLQEYFGNLQENLSSTSNDENECKKRGLKLAKNPSVCTEEDSYEPSANCKCVDDDDNCKLCYSKINY
jgi:hypothetical protein